jgi:carbon-monoxide dehydrogenase catalytic subunit
MSTEDVKQKVVVAKKKEKKAVKPEDLSIDTATAEMIERSREMEIETIFDRAQNMKPCNIGIQGTCCKNCAQGPCRLPLPKGAMEGKDTRKGLCGATPETIASRNFARMVAAGAASHSDHGRGVAETFLAAARKETEDYSIQDTKKLLEIAPDYGVDVTVEGEEGEILDRDIDEIAVEVGEKALAQWGQQQGEVCLVKRAPEPRYELWKKLGVIPRGIDRETVEMAGAVP